MRKALLAGFSILSVLVLTGCPWLQPRSVAFTSADLRSGSYYRDGFLALFGPAAELDDASGDATPREVVEPDVIRREGSLLYVLNQYRGLSVVDLDTKETLGSVPTYGFPRDLYIEGNRAYVLVSYASHFDTDGDTVTYETSSRLYVVDITSPASASIVSEFELEGDLIDSRLVGDVLYAVSAELYWYWDVDVAVFKGQTQSSWVTSVSIADEDNIAAVDTVSFPGSGSVIHVTDSALFVAAPDYGTNGTSITYVDISDPSGDMAVRGGIGIDGYVGDTFKLDVYDGVLRVVSSSWSDTRRVFITTVDLADPDNLAKLAKTELERASGETLFATRFDGPRAYVVTYLVVDPLFIVDLSDPANPAVTGELEVPGWSTHIVPQGDRLVALGVDDTNGRKVSVSLFDVADAANPGLLDRVSFGAEWSWSNAYNDVKSLTVLDDTIIVPFSGYEESGGYDRLQFVSYTATDLALRDALDVQGTVVRSFEDGPETYAVTSEQLVWMDASDLDNVTIEGSLTLAENVLDFVELSSSVGVEVIGNYATNTTLVRATDLPLKGIAAGVSLEVGSVVGVHAYGDSVVVVGSDYTGTGRYKVAKVDFSNPAAPVLAKQINVNVTPYYGYWWYLPYAPLVDTAGFAADIATVWWWSPPLSQDISVVAGGTMVLRCNDGDYDSTIGPGTASEGLASVDLATLTWTRTTGLGYDFVSAIAPSENQVLISTCQGLNSLNPLQAPLCAYYMTAFHPATGVAGDAANVPGTLVSYDSVSDVLVLSDDQWVSGFDVNRSLKTVRWSGGADVESLDDAELAPSSANVVGRGTKVFIEGYDGGTTLRAASITGDGVITLGSTILATDQWGYLVDALPDRAYVAIGGGAIAEYGVTGTALGLDTLTPVMGGPTKLRFGDEAAYAPLGFSGIVALPY